MPAHGNDRQILLAVLPSAASLWKPLLLALMLLCASAAHAQPAHEMPRPADRVPLALQSLVLDIVRTPRNWVAVGERGHVLLSSDGVEWEQAQFVPVQANLTRVTYTDGLLWAVGHDSTILHSYDYGQTWVLQNFEPSWEKPLLDVHFFDRQSGIAVGAFGLFMRTADGGHNWQALNMADLVTGEMIDWEAAAEVARQGSGAAAAEGLDEDWGDDDLGAGEDWLEDDEWLDDDEMEFDQGCYQFMECHLNAFVDLGNGRQMIAAERGYGFRSVDGGQTWEAFMFPYHGSMFGLLANAEGQVVAFGLRGFVQISDNFGEDWEVLDFGLRSTLKGGILLDERRALLVGSGSTRLTLDIDQRQADVEQDRLGRDLVAVAQGSAGRILLGGAGGLSHE